MQLKLMARERVALTTALLTRDSNQPITEWRFQQQFIIKSALAPSWMSEICVFMKVALFFVAFVKMKFQISNDDDEWKALSSHNIANYGDCYHFFGRQEIIIAVIMK